MTKAREAAETAADVMADKAIEHAWYGKDPVVIGKSPPGGGKTFLVECAAVAAAALRMKVVCITPGVSQAYDLVERLGEYDLPRLELVHASHRQLPGRLVGKVRDFNGWDARANQGPGVLIANAHVLASYLDRIRPHSFDRMIVDESYQLAANDFMPVADLAPRVLMVGDPGQLPPVSSVDTGNMEAALHKVHWSAPAYVLDRFPATPVYGLPVTRRLLPDTARLVQKSFYSDLPFESVVSPQRRRLRFGVPGIGGAIDRCLDAIVAGASIVGLVLPGGPPAHTEVDAEVAALIADVAARFLIRQGSWIGERALGERDIGCIDPNVLSGGAISDRLRKGGRSDVRVDTVEKWQGLQVPVSVVRHPLSKIGRPTPFDLAAGRWCVALSRHQIACVIVARKSIESVISEYVHACDSVAAGAQDYVWRGFSAHQTIWKELRDRQLVFEV